MARQYVHLSNNRADALEVGRRKHLRVNAADAANAGIAFYVGNGKSGWPIACPGPHRNSG